MKRKVGVVLGLAIPWLVCCGGGGAGGSGAGALTPLGAECGVAPPGECQIDASRSDTQRFEGLNALSKELLDETHPLHNMTLAGGQLDQPIGTHVQSVGVIMSTWDSEQKSNDPIGARRNEGGNLYPVTQRLRCAADRLIELGAKANPKVQVCWAQELWRVGRAYARLAAH